MHEWARMISEETYVGPVLAFDDFKAAYSRLGFGRPRNNPVPEPNGKLAVYDGYDIVPPRISILYTGRNAAKKDVSRFLKALEPGAVVVFPEGSTRSKIEARPLFFQGDMIAARLV